MWPHPDDDDEEGLELVRSPEAIAQAERDPVFREFVNLYLQTSDEGREKIRAGMKRMAALPKEIQGGLTPEQLERVFNGDPIFPVN
jgi:hypothetical protein